MVIGTERHESRRIDNQLRGRSGRQGDPGHSKFFLSLQDDLMRIFPVESMDSMLSKLGLEQGESITHPWVTKAIERAQGRVEARNFDIRKNILKYDDVMNDQRKVIFEQRLELMDKEDVAETISDMRHDVVDAIIARAIPERSYPEQWKMELLNEELKQYLNLELDTTHWPEEEGIDVEIVRERLIKAADEAAAAKVATIHSPEHHAPGREVGAAAVDRQSVARASRDARSSEQGGRLARPRPARPAQRVQAGSL